MLVGETQVLRQEQGELQEAKCERAGTVQEESWSCSQVARTCIVQLLQILGTDSNRHIKQMPSDSTETQV